MEFSIHENHVYNYSLKSFWKWPKLQMGRIFQGDADNSKNELSEVSLCLFSRPQTKNWNISDHFF